MSDDEAYSAQVWLKKALEDWSAVEILAAHSKPPIPLVCFHSQQYVEKLLKGYLSMHGIEAPRTHNIGRLIQLAAPKLPRLALLADMADALSAHGVLSRYPDDGYSSDRREMKRMITIAKKFSEVLLPELRPVKPQH